MGRPPAATALRRFLPLAMVVVFALLLLVALQKGETSHTKPDRLIGAAFPAVTLPALSAGEPNLNLPLPHGEVWVLNVFASWCASCIVEHEELKNWKAGSPATPFIGMTWRDKPEATQTWLAKMGNVYTAIGMDAHGEAAIALGLTGVPETYVIDRNGKIAGALRGPLTPEKRRDWLEPLVKSLETR